MTSIIWLTFGATITIVPPLLLWRYRCRRKVKKTLARSKKPYASVAIHPCLMSCDAVNRMGNKRFLEDEVPSLPLAACDSEKCQCRYKYFDDRRGEEERRLPFGEATMTLGASTAEDERRKRTDRRVNGGENIRQAPAYFNEY